MGFGLGSGAMAALAAAGMITNLGISTTIYIFGAVFLVALVVAAQFMVAPPAGYVPEGWTPPAGAPAAAAGLTLGEAVRTKYYYLFWLMLFVNIAAGMAVISQVSPMSQSFMDDTFADKAKTAGTFMLLFALFNGIGRLFWASLSDKIGRRTVFFILFGSQAVVFYVLSITPPFWVFIILACYVYACLGGGFATMPAYAADTFGTKYVGRIYGWMLTAWGAAGIVGPLVYASIYKAAIAAEEAAHSVTATGLYSQAFLFTAIMFAVALIIPALAAPKKLAA
jgi:OFA family oxalate/formate antiporter-like MFS transporter